MKKFFKSLLKALGYFLIYFGVQLVVGAIWGAVAGMAISMKYAAQGANLLDPAVMELYTKDLEQVVAEITVPATIVGNLLAIGVICLIFVCRKKKVAKELSLRKFSGKAVFPVLLMGVGFNLLTNFALGLLPQEILDEYVEASSSLVGNINFWTVFLAVIAAPLAEEIVMRGLVYTRMKKGMPAVVAMILSSVLFGVLHGQWLWMIYTALFGMVLVWIFERTQSLWACILLHFSYNGCSMLLSLIPETAPDWVSIVLLAAAVVLTAVGLLLFLKVPKAEAPAEEVAVAETVETVAGVEEIAAESAEDETETL